MSVALSEAPRALREATGKPKALTVSTATVDYTPRHPQSPRHPGGYTPLDFARDLGTRLPREITREKVGDKVTVDKDSFYRLVDEMLDLRVRGNNVVLDRTVGGNAINVGIRLAAMRGPDDGLVVPYTWAANDANGDLIRDDLDRPGLLPYIVQSNETPAGLVIPRINEETGKLDRTIFSFKPKDMPSDFAEWLKLNENPDFAVINSSTGPKWPTSLRRGKAALLEEQVPWTFTPGTSHLETIVKGEDPDAIEAVYEMIDGSLLLAVDQGELNKLIRGRGMEPSPIPFVNLNQARELGAEHVIVTLGSDGARGTSQDGRSVFAEAPQIDHEEDTTGAGDAMLAKAADELVKGHSLKRAIGMGSVSAASAVETRGAHTSPPSEEVLYERYVKRSPQVYEFS